ncbi:unnamed protein product [Cunninghamella blakesleeana]
MDTLPNEVLYFIFTHLPQRHIFTICSVVCKKWNGIITQPFLYLIMNLYSKAQLEKIIQFAKEKIGMNQTPITYHVKRLIFHYECCISRDTLNDIISLYPNLQRFDCLCDERYSTYIYRSKCMQSIHHYRSIYLALDQPTHFIYTEDSEQWTAKFSRVKKKLKSLHIHMLEKRFGDAITEQQQQQFDPIQLKNIGIKTEDVIERQYSSDVLTTKTLPVKMLVLSTTSTFIYLTKLSIEFFIHYEIFFTINEYTFNNINQTCPSLESLYISHFHMDMFDEDDTAFEYYIGSNNDNKKYKPADRLKTFAIRCGTFGDPRSFYYFANKYPNLESLSMDLWFQNIYEEKIPSFEQAIFDMLSQFPLLKKISFCHEVQFTESNWFHYIFLTWLYQHPHQLTHLGYSYNLTVDESLIDKSFHNMNVINNIDQGNSLTELQLQQPPNFLQHLTSLTLTLKSLIPLATIYLSQNPSSTILSMAMKNLKIEEYSKFGVNKVYIYDWLDVFPNLILLQLNHIHISDNEDNDDVEFNKDSIKLHQLIYQRKQQQQQQLDILNKKHKTHVYKLEKLCIWYCKVWFKNGFAELLKKCLRLKTLHLNDVTFIHPSISLHNEIYFDLSHIHLKYFYINDLYFIPSVDHEDIHLKILTIDETFTGSRRKFVNDRNQLYNYYYNLYIKCKYVDELVFEN